MYNDRFALNFDTAMRNTKTTNKQLSEWITDNYKKISKETIGKYRNGTRTPSPDFIYHIAEYFQMGEQFFFDGTIFINTKMIPLIGLASCGIPQEYNLDNYDSVPVSADIYKDGMYAVRAEGDSMSPKINDGALVYCIADEQIDNGHIVHYSVNGESGIKKYKINEKGDIISLIPLNPDYDIITIHADDNALLKMSRVVGVVDTDF